MKKKTSALAIVVAVIFSILLFPFIFISGISSGVVFSLESVVAPGREEDLYQSFTENGGMDWVYDTLIAGVEEGLSEGFTVSATELGDVPVDISFDAKELLPRDQVDTIAYDVYHAIIKGETYQFDLSYQKDLIETKLNEFFETTVTEKIIATIDETAEEEIKKEYGEAYDLMSESERQELLEKAKEEATKIAMEEAENLFDTEVMTTLETEVASLEEELTETINSIYDTPEWQELKDLEAQYGYSLADRTQLCRDIRMAGYILLGITAVLLVVLLLCHWFRPAGFFTAGAFSLVTGGVLLAGAKVVKNVMMGLIGSEISSVSLSEEALQMDEFLEAIMLMIEDILGWCLTGFEKVGKIGLMAAVIFILVGILLLVIRRNKTEAEPESVMGMQ